MKRSPPLDYRPRDARTPHGWRHSLLDASGRIWLVGMALGVLAIAAIIAARVVPEIAHAVDRFLSPRATALVPGAGV